VDPATASETDIRDAFRKYTPTGQQDRMVSLFIGLFTAAGVMPPRERSAAPRKTGGGMRVTRVSTSTPRARKPPTPPAPRNRSGGGAGQVNVVDLPPALSGLLQSLPIGQSWTQEQRDIFYKTFGAVLDFCIPIGEPEEPQIAPEHDENGG
jgi:hypothetical protein